ncbi:MAG: site-specific DNA-methyltransferase [Candidatus Babeliales bacterium]|jgi:site-specific DNA-methyltransferase (adenine-specific)
MIENLLKMIKGALGVGMVHNGDSQFILKAIPSNKIDYIVTDPPYGYSFMGKNWDKAVPAIAIWQECYRILKPGAFMFVMSAPRQDVLSEMITRIAKAGFDTSFTSIYWTYASGFPKAMNIAKAVDKRLDVERTVVGTIKTHDIRNNSLMEARTPEQKKEQQTIEIEKTVATSPQAKALDGSYGGFQPKPAVEIVIVAMKPLSEKTYVDQALANGHGVTWLDKCRIPHKEPIVLTDRTPRTEENTFNDDTCGFKKEVNHIASASQDGRFPANLLVSDDVLNDGSTHKSGTIESHHQIDKQKTTEIYGEYTNLPAEQQTTYGDSGSYSRFFDLDAWWNKTVDGLPENVKATFPFLIVPKASKSERNKDCEELGGTKRFSSVSGVSGKMLPSKSANLESHEVTGNFHPTVKPLKLMCYLITLGSQANDIVLDPFNGSGTTCLAAKIMNRQWLGVDISDEYCKIESARLGSAPIVKHEPPKQDIKSQPANQPKIAKVSSTNVCCALSCTFKDEFGDCSGNGLKLHCKDRGAKP